MTKFHFGPLAPYLCKIFYGLEVDFGTFLHDFSCTIEIWFGLSSNATLLVKLGKVNV